MSECVVLGVYHAHPVRVWASLSLTHSRSLFSLARREPSVAAQQVVSKCLVVEHCSLHDCCCDSLLLQTSTRANNRSVCLDEHSKLLVHKQSRLMDSKDPTNSKFKTRDKTNRRARSWSISPSTRVGVHVSAIGIDANGDVSAHVSNAHSSELHRKRARRISCSARLQSERLMGGWKATQHAAMLHHAASFTALAD